MWTPESQRRDLERWRREGGYDLENEENQQRVFIDINTGERYRVPQHYPPAEARITGKPPFQRSQIFTLTYVDGPRAGEYSRLDGGDLEEETPILEGMLRYQADHLEESYNVMWTRFGREKEPPIVMHRFNPYLRDELTLRSAEHEARLDTRKRRRVFHFVEVYNDLKSQPADVIAIWLAMTDYDLPTMSALAKAGKHFANVLRTDFIWKRAFIYHFGLIAVRCMALGPNPKLHPWLIECLDATTSNSKLRGQRYFKRILELHVRSQRMVVAPETAGKPKFLNMSAARFPVHIWQCGEHIYGLFSGADRIVGVKRGQTLVYWNARREEPLRIIEEGDNVYRLNLIGADETFDYIYHDQNGFVCRINNVLIYTFADIPHGKYTSTYRVPRSNYQKNFNMTILPLNFQRVHLMPTCICLQKALIPRAVNHRLGNPVMLENNVEIIGVIDHNQILVTRHIPPTKEGKLPTQLHYIVTNPLEHPQEDESWRQIYNSAQIRHYHRVAQPQTFALICHYRQETKKLEWHNYNDFVQGLWQRKRLATLDLTSAQLCDHCQWMPVAAKCGHGCEQAQYCGQECADAHYEKHDCPKK